MLKIRRRALRPWYHFFLPHSHKQGLSRYIRNSFLPLSYPAAVTGGTCRSLAPGVPAVRCAAPKPSSILFGPIPLSLRQRHMAFRLRDLLCKASLNVLSSSLLFCINWPVCRPITFRLSQSPHVVKPCGTCPRLPCACPVLRICLRALLASASWHRLPDSKVPVRARFRSDKYATVLRLQSTQPKDRRIYTALTGILAEPPPVGSSCGRRTKPGNGRGAQGHGRQHSLFLSAPHIKSTTWTSPRPLGWFLGDWDYE